PSELSRLVATGRTPLAGSNLDPAGAAASPYRTAPARPRSEAHQGSARRAGDHAGTAATHRHRAGGSPSPSAATAAADRHRAGRAAAATGAAGHDRHAAFHSG